MFALFRSLWTRLCNQGVSPGMDPRIAKRILLANQFALSLPALVLLFMPLHLLQGVPESALVGGFVALAYLLVPWLHSAAWPSFSRLVIVTVGNVGILLHCILMGSGTDMHIYFCTGTWMGMVLFAPHERKSLAFSVILPTSMLVGFLAFDHAVGGWNPQPAGRTRHIDLYNLIGFQIVQVVTVLYFYISNHRTETALARAGELAQAADRAKSRFLANMSHEIRTPLNGILGLSGIMLGDRLPPKQRDTLLGIHSSAMDLLGLVNDLLDISRIEAGMMRLDPAPFRLRALAEAVLAPFRYEAERKRLDLALRVEADVPDSLLGDSIRLKQVLNNLLGNAFKFTDKGGISLRIRLDDGLAAAQPAALPVPAGVAAGFDLPEAPVPVPARAAAGAARLRFEVEDTGIGIPDASHTAVFRPFTQVDQSTTRRHEGAGLGLFISRQIVERMGGLIGFQSAPGQGSVFHFTVDLPLAEAVPEALRDAPAPESAPALQDLSLLLVEDHALNRKVMSGMLAARGITADEAPGAREALEAMARKAYRVIFTDLHMPGMDGFGFTRQVRAAAGPQPFIVGVTADAMVETRSRCLQAGMDDVLTKPILSRDLDALLARLSAQAPPSAPAGGNPEASSPARSAYVIEVPSPAPEPPAQVEEPAPGLRLSPEPGLRLTAEPWVDGAHVLELDEWVRTNDTGFWDRAMEQFRQDVARLGRGVREAMAGDRLVEASEAAHSLKGVALMLGFRRIGRLGKILEERIREPEGPDWAAALAAIEAGVEPSVAELRHRLLEAAAEAASLTGRPRAGMAAGRSKVAET